MRLALFQPDIPQNTGTLLRLAACLAIAVDLIEPAGFDMTDRALKRSGLDYLDHVDLMRHLNWDAFADEHKRRGGRLVLATTKAAVSHLSARFEAGDVILLGRESAGVPDYVHRTADLRVRVPLVPELRSLNIAAAGAIILGEALRQTDGFPAGLAMD